MGIRGRGVSMTITIELSDDLAARLTAAGIGAADASRFAVATLTGIADRADVDAAEVRAWWDGLSREEQAAEKASLRSSLAVAEVGLCSQASDVYSRIRA